MVHTCHCTFVKAHRIYNTVSEPSYKQVNVNSNVKYHSLFLLVKSGDSTQCLLAV